MKYLLWTNLLFLFWILGSISAADAKRFWIDPRKTWLLAAASLPKAVLLPREWAGSLLTAFLFTSALLWAVNLFVRKKERKLMGGGDIKLFYALLIHVDAALLLPFIGVVCLYILLLRFTWPESRKLPLAPALCGALACLLLREAIFSLQAIPFS